MSAFTPIKGEAGDWHQDRDDVAVFNQTDQERITALLMGHEVTKVDGEHLLIDNGTVIKAIGHDGGCACSAGCYGLSVLNGVDNVITRVEYDYQPASDDDYWDKGSKARTPSHPDDPKDRWTGFYRVFVYADNQKVNLMQFDGSDGNGYYGTGFELLVREVTA